MEAKSNADLRAAVLSLYRLPSPFFWCISRPDDDPCARLLDRSYFTDVAANTIYIPATLPTPLLLILLMFLSQPVDAYGYISQLKEKEEEEEGRGGHLHLL